MSRTPCCGREVGRLAAALAKGADHRSHLLERTGRLLLDDDEGVGGRPGLAGRQDTTGLGPDRDGRHVVGDRVVQLPGQLGSVRVTGCRPAPAREMPAGTGRTAPRVAASSSTSAPPTTSPAGSPPKAVSTTGTATMASPPATSRPEPHRVSAYGSRSRNTAVPRPSHSTSRTRPTTSAMLTAPKAIATTASGWTRRQGKVAASATVNASENGRHTRSVRDAASPTAITMTTATRAQSLAAGPDGSGARGSAHNERTVSIISRSAYGTSIRRGSAERTIPPPADRPGQEWPDTRCARRPPARRWVP